MVVLRHALPAGAVVQGFEILSVLGAGGFGVTYLARDPQLGQLRAIKEFYPRELVEREQGRVVTVRSEEERPSFDAGLRSFLSEARIGASLDHPGIARVLAFFEANGTGYVVMPYYEGSTLQQQLQARPGASTPEEVLETLLPVLDALEYVHGRGLIHRDIKPANIYLRAVGGPLLIDFGAARMASRGTRPLTAILTPGYAPPEQYLPEAPQGAFTDLYAVGAVMYRMLSGTEPKDAYTRSVGGLDGDPLVPLSRLAGQGLAPAFSAAIDRCLRMNPAARFATVAELRAALLPSHAVLPAPPASRVDGTAATIAPALTRAMPTASAVPGSGQRKLVLRQGVGLLVVLLTVLAGWWWWRPGPRSELPDSRAANVATHPGGAVFRDALASGGEGPEMLAVPGGTFDMGSITLELDRRADEGPQHPVSVPDFALARFELTVAEFRAFVTATGYITDAERDRGALPGVATPGCQVALTGGFDWLRNTSWKQPMRPLREREPVVCISRDDAAAYAAWLSAETGQRYRLPSEAEFEYALRGGRRPSTWPWAEAELPLFCRYANLDHTQTGGWVDLPCDDHQPGVATGGSFEPNPLGLYDLSGNVAEWTADCFHADYTGAPADGQVWEGADCPQAVARGASWHDGLVQARVAARAAHPVGWRSALLGVRLARALGEH